MISHGISPWFPIDNHPPTKRAQVPAPAMRLRSLTDSLAVPLAETDRVVHQRRIGLQCHVSMGFYSDLMGFYSDLMGLYSDLMGFYSDSMGY